MLMNFLHGGGGEEMCNAHELFAWSFIAHGMNVIKKCAQRWLGMRRLKHLVSVRFEFRDEFAHVKKI